MERFDVENTILDLSCLKVLVKFNCKENFEDMQVDSVLVVIGGHRIDITNLITEEDNIKILSVIK